MPRKKVRIAIPKLKQHSDKVLAELNYECTKMEFIKEYKKQYPEEYSRYERNYSRVIKEQKQGKGTPPAPKKYFELAYNNAVVRYKKGLIAENKEQATE